MIKYSTLNKFEKDSDMSQVTLQHELLQEAKNIAENLNGSEIATLSGDKNIGISQNAETFSMSPITSFEVCGKTFFVGFIKNS